MKEKLTKKDLISIKFFDGELLQLILNNSIVMI